MVLFYNNNKSPFYGIIIEEHRKRGFERMGGGITLTKLIDNWANVPWYDRLQV